MRTQTTTIAGKTIQVNELRVSELKKLISKTGADFMGFSFGDGQEDWLNAGMAFIQKHIVEIWSEITPDDIENAYPSEIEALFEAFVAVNFFGVQRLYGGLLGLADKASKLNTVRVHG